MGVPYSQRRLPRRTFLYLSTSALVSLVATACGGSTATPTAQTTTSSSAASTSAASTSAAASTTRAASSTSSAATSSAAATSAATGSATTSRAGSATSSASSSSSSASSSAAAVPTKFQEAPALADQVKAGKLPPVAERVSSSPMVIQPIQSVGVYGGKWRSAYTGAADSAWFSRTIGYESLVRWDVDWKNLVPDIAEKYEVSPDGKEFTWHLRKGMKWSDGQPFGSDDFVFWDQDVVHNSDLTPAAPPSWYTVGGKPGTVVKVDDTTFKMVFEQPNGLLLKKLAMLGGGTFIKPAHYAKQFHAKYNKEAVDKMVADQHLANWAALFNQKVGTVTNVGDARWFNPELPTIFPWIVQSGIGEKTQVTATRNPYYWKVDPQGNQLPYLDELVYPLVDAQAVDTLVLKAANGEIDMEDRHFTNATNKPVLTDNQQKGQYHFFTETPDSMNTFIVLFNFNHKDPVLRKIIQTTDFRIALSHAIDRKAIQDTVFVSQGTPWQAAPLKQSPYYHEKLATQYLDFDLDKANQLLDGMGLKKGSDGIRLRPDGKKLSMVFEFSTNAVWGDVIKLLQTQWAKVGFEITPKSEDRALRQTRLTALDHDVTNWGGDGGIDAILGPYWYLAYASFNCFASAWALWWETGGKQGEEPPAPAKKQQDLYDQIVITADANKQKDLMKQILDIAAEQFWIMGICTPSEGYGLVKNDFHNVPDHMFSSGQEYCNPGAAMPEQFYIKD